MAILVEGVPLLRRERTFKVFAPQLLSGLGQGVFPDHPIDLGIAMLGKVGGEVLNRSCFVGLAVVAMLKEAGKNPLGPLVIFWAAGSDLPGPIIAEPQEVELLAVTRNVALCC